MAPKKKEQQKMTLGAFMTDEKLGSWADEMEDMPVYSHTGYAAEKRTFGAPSGGSNLGGYSVREELPLPDKPPYTVHLGNLSFDATVADVTDFFADCDCVNVRIIEDKMEMRPKGFGYAEFGTREGIIKALGLSGSQFQGRNIRISVADPPKVSDRPDVREFGDWSRKGPLPDLPGRAGADRRPFDKPFESARERRDPFPLDDGKVRDFGNWERRGPLPSAPQPERPMGTREGGRPTTTEGPFAEGFRDRRASPAAWGEARAQDSQDGSRPPRREFQAPTAAEQDSQWRTKMKADAPATPVTASAPSRDASEGPASPAAAAAPGGRPKLNLTKRTVADTETASPSSATGDAKASPFGAARPIDTAAKEREIEEKRVAALKEKKEAEDKAREEKRIANEAAKAEKEKEKEKESHEVKTENDATTVPDVAKKTEGLSIEDASEHKDEASEPKASESKTDEAAPKDAPTAQKPADTRTWRRSGPGPKSPQNNAPKGPRGDGPSRGPRNDVQRGSNANGKAEAAPVAVADSETAVPEDDGWSTVSKPKKNQRGGR